MFATFYKRLVLTVHQETPADMLGEFFIESACENSSNLRSHSASERFQAFLYRATSAFLSNVKVQSPPPL